MAGSTEKPWISHETEIAIGPKLEPWRRHRRCPACGESGRLRDQLLRLVWQAPDRHFAIGYCAGGKEPTETVTVQSLMGPQQIEGRYDCAGVFEPHLHLTCRNCGHRFLSKPMRVKP